MAIETILWTVLVVTVSMFAGWVLGNFYAISRMRSKRKPYADPDTLSGDHASEFVRDNSGRPLYRVNKGDYLPEFLRRKEWTPLLKNPPGPEFEIATQGDPRKE